MKRSKRHHYVPIHLTKRFCGEDGRTFVFDKKNSKTFKQVPKNIFVQNLFHEFRTDNYFVSFENVISSYEHIYLPALNKLYSGKELNDLSSEELGQLCTLIAFQYLRSRDMRKRFLEMQERVYSQVKSFAAGQKATITPDIVPMENDALTKFSYRFIEKSLQDFTEAVAEKHLYLIRAPKGHEFLLGENPVVLHNEYQNSFHSNLGWKSIGLQIYLPITPKLCLAAWCNSVFGKTAREMDKSENDLKALKLMSGHLVDLVPKHDEAMRLVQIEKRKFDSLYKKIVLHRKITAKQSNMDFYNSLQSSWARQFIISRNGDFSLTKKVIS